MTPSVAEREAHTISVTVSDPHPGNLAQFAWRVRITDPDADGDGWAANSVADCDDTNGDVHPNRLEVLFNGLDDDCNASTPDSGSDLGEGGQLWSWGQGYGNPRGDNATPGPVAKDAGNIVQISSTFRTTWWLNRDGSVRGQGINGNGNSGVSPTGDVYGIGSASGSLQGIAEITEGADAVFARTNDGHVVSWGEEGGRGILGAGTPLYGRNYPDYVVGPDTDGNSTPDPLANVTKVWQMGWAGLARTADGTMYQWGQRQCADAGWGVRPQTAVAVVEPVLTDKLATMVQADGSGNNPGSAIFRMADGSCSHAAPSAGGGASTPGTS